jgi:catechol 2,3-dioxygenase-like lactoylglutathione lyase family enzyme
MTIRGLSPMLLATDLRETIDFYTNVLGFTLEATLEDPPTWCSLKRDGVHLMFVWDEPHDHAPGEEHDHPPPTITGVLYLYPDDVPALYAEVKERWPICEELGVRPHGMIEFAVLDPNGYRLRFGADP